jgi:uncharacterized protein involved in outer membrane biogenesis
LRRLLKAGAVLGALAVVLVVLFMVGIPVPGDFLRAPLEGLLSKAFGVPTRIEGPLNLRTGLVASAEVGALILVDPLNPGATPLARATHASVRVDLGALLRRAVKLDDIAAERVEIKLERAADGRGNWEPLLASSDTPPLVKFAGIGQLRIVSVAASYRGQGGAEPVRFEVKSFEGMLSEREPATARGTLSTAGRTLAFDASSASLAELLEGPGKPIPLRATAESSGARVEVSGTYAQASAVLEATVHIAANNADAVLAALGVTARESGALDVRGQVRVNRREAAIDALALRLGKTSMSGGIRLNWAEVRPSIALDLAAERVDQTPFLAGAEPAHGKAPMVGFVELIHHVATSVDLDAKASVSEFIGMAAGWRDAKVESRIHDNVLALRAGGELLGMKAKVALDYSARDPKRALTWHLEGGRFSTEKLPGTVQLGEIAGTLGGLRGELKASGADSQELVASARLNLDARDLRFSWSRRGERPQELHLTSARLDIASGRSARAQVHGRLGGRPCSLKVAGGTLESLISGERWPLQLDALCRGARLASKGHVVMKGRETTAGLEFNASANPIGPFAEALGLATDVPHAFAISGELSLTEALARVKVDRFRLGRTAGGGTVSLARDGKQAHRLELSLTTVDTAELATLAPRQEKKAPVDPLSREVMPAKVHVPDLDLQLTAGTVQHGAQALRDVKLSAAPREGHVRNARFAFQWRGAAVAGELSADFRGARPTVELSSAVQGADLGAALAPAGHKSFALRAGRIRASARAAGVKLGELLGSATADAVVEQARLGNVQQFIPGLTGDAEFSAKLVVTEGQPVRLSANGSAGKLPFDVAVETAPLTQLAQLEDQLPATLRAALGETRVDASGRLALKGTGDLRLTLSGERLDRLGRLAAVKLPEVGPYAAAANLVIAPGSIRASSIDAKFGKSRVLGSVGVERAGTRPAYTAELRAPVLHLEDLGLHLFAGTDGKSKPGGAGAPAEEAVAAREIGQLEKLLRAFDAKASLGVEALYGEGKRYASLRTSLALRGGDLQVAVQDVHVSGGKGQADLRLDASGPRPRMHLRVLTEGFEFGPLAEALRPNTALEGTLDLSLNLALDGLQEPFLENVNGHVDLAVFPRGLPIGAADYWGTGLLHVLQRSVDPASESRLNCAVAIFDVKNGVARSEAFFADTTRVRIIGELEANLASRKLSGRLSPNAKNPRLLTVSPSVGIGGTLESPEIIVTPDSLITAPLRLVFPIHAFAFDWLNAAGVPADGSAGCRQAFEQAATAGSKKPAAPRAPGHDRGPS